MAASERGPAPMRARDEWGSSRAEPAFVEFVGLLSRSPSGIGFIYHALDLVAARYDLRDAVAVVHSPGVGRQAFRLGRTRVQSTPPRVLPEGMGSLDDAEPGLYTDPPVVDRLTSAYVSQLIDVALRLDILDHDARHDPLTGLLNRRSYEAALADAVARTRRYGWPFALVTIDLD
ncbi:MAG: GGDEF domain-containing protein, partial [Actinomycetes bacterium]